MAPPETNLEEQKRGHRVPLVGMGVLVTLVLIGFVWWVTYAVETSDEPNVIEETPAEAVE